MNREALPGESMPRLMVPRDYIHNALFFDITDDGAATPEAQYYDLRRQQESAVGQMDNGLNVTPRNLSLQRGPRLSPQTRSSTAASRCLACFPPEDGFTSPSPAAGRPSTASEQQLFNAMGDGLALTHFGPQGDNRERTARLSTTSGALIDRLSRPTRSGVLRAEHMARQQHIQEEAENNIHFVKGKDTSRVSILFATDSRTGGSTVAPPARLTKAAELLREHNAKRMKEVEEEQQRKRDEEEEIGLGFRSATSNTNATDARNASSVNATRGTSKVQPEISASRAAPPTKSRRSPSLADRWNAAPSPLQKRGEHTELVVSSANPPGKPARRGLELFPSHRDPAQQQRPASPCSSDSSIDFHIEVVTIAAAVQRSKSIALESTVRVLGPGDGSGGGAAASVPESTAPPSKSNATVIDLTPIAAPPTNAGGYKLHTTEVPSPRLHRIASLSSLSSVDESEADPSLAQAELLRKLRRSMMTTTQPTNTSQVRSAVLFMPQVSSLSRAHVVQVNRPATTGASPAQRSSASVSPPQSHPAPVKVTRITRTTLANCNAFQRRQERQRQRRHFVQWMGFRRSHSHQAAYETLLTPALSEVPVADEHSVSTTLSRPAAIENFTMRMPLSAASPAATSSHRLVKAPFVPATWLAAPRASNESGMLSRTPLESVVLPELQESCGPFNDNTVAQAARPVGLLSPDKTQDHSLLHGEPPKPFSPHRNGSTRTPTKPPGCLVAVPATHPIDYSAIGYLLPDVIYDPWVAPVMVMEQPICASGGSPPSLATPPRDVGKHSSIEGMRKRPNSYVPPPSDGRRDKSTCTPAQVLAAMARAGGSRAAASSPVTADPERKQSLTYLTSPPKPGNDRAVGYRRRTSPPISRSPTKAPPVVESSEAPDLSTPPSCGNGPTRNLSNPLPPRDSPPRSSHEPTPVAARTSIDRAAAPLERSGQEREPRVPDSSLLPAGVDGPDVERPLMHSGSRHPDSHAPTPVHFKESPNDRSQSSPPPRHTRRQSTSQHSPDGERPARFALPSLSVPRDDSVPAASPPAPSPQAGDAKHSREATPTVALPSTSSSFVRSESATFEGAVLPESTAVHSSGMTERDERPAAPPSTDPMPPRALSERVGIFSDASSSLPSSPAHPSRRASLVQDADPAPLQLALSGRDGAPRVPTQRKFIDHVRTSHPGSLDTSVAVAADPEASQPGTGVADQPIAMEERPCAPVPPARSSISGSPGRSSAFTAWSAATPADQGFASPNMSEAGAPEDLAHAFGPPGKSRQTPPIRPRYYHTDL